MKLISISDIDLDRSPKVRAETNDATVEEYAEVYRVNPTQMPPVVVYVQEGHSGCLLADGNHRVLGASEAGLGQIAAIIRDGDYQAALEYALGANAAHGLRRTRADKRKCVAEALRQWPEYSNARLSRLCMVDDHLIADVRTELQASATIQPSATRISAQGREVPAARQPRKSEAVDLNGTPIPVEVQKYWNRMNEPKSMIESITEVMGDIKRLMDAKDIMFAEVNHTGVLADLEKARRSIECAVPAYVCTQCGGHPDTQRAGCRLCMGRGLISKFRWQAVPEEVRAMRVKK